MPAVVERIGVEELPYVILWSIPQNSFAGEVLVRGEKLMLPVNLEPNASQ
jgi:hypothetical protein